MPGIAFESNIEQVSSIAGSLTGIVEGIDSLQYKTNFITLLMNKIETAFMIDSIATRDRIRHVFEWPDEADGPTSDVPLFKLVRAGRGEDRSMAYEFLPSTKMVPLPSAKFNIKPEIIERLKRHIFTNKAIVMETQTAVTILPSQGGRIFIPVLDNPRGYVMTPNGATVNPGGNFTGKFNEWWVSWMDSRAQEIALQISQKRETQNVANAQKVIRDAAGRYTTGTAKSFSYSRGVAYASTIAMEGEDI